MVQLYSYFRSSCSYRVRIALHHKDITYKYIPVHLVKNGGEQNCSTFLNSKNEVPVLKDKNITLSQSSAIFLYLDRTYLKEPLFPKELPFFEQCFELIELINTGIQPIQNLSVLQKLKKEFKITDDQKNEWVRHFIAKGLKAYQEKLKENSLFSIGDHLTAADMFLIPQMYNAHRFNVNMKGLEHLVDIETRCLKLDCFKKAHPDVQPDSPKNKN